MSVSLSCRISAPSPTYTTKLTRKGYRLLSSAKRPPTSIEPLLLLALMASPSAGLSRDASALPPVAGGAPCNAAGAQVDTTHLDRLVEKALTSTKCGRYVLADGFYRSAVDETTRLHDDTFVCTFLIVKRAALLRCQAQLEGVPPDEQSPLNDDAWALVSSCLPLIVRRMDDNTILPGRGSAVELAFFKRFSAMKQATHDALPLSTRQLQLVGLCLRYATAASAADLLLGLLCLRHDSEAEAFVLRVVDTMLPATRSLNIGKEMAKRSLLHPIFSKPFLVPFPCLTRRLSPHSVQNGRLRRWCGCAGNVACWIFQRRLKTSLRITTQGGARTSRSTA